MHFSATDPASSRSKALLQSRTGPGINSRAADEFAQSVRGWHSGSSAKSAAEISLAQLDLAETTFGRIAPPPSAVLLFRQADKLTISRPFRFKSVVVFFMLIFLFLVTHAFDYTARSRFVSGSFLVPRLRRQRPD